MRATGIVRRIDDLGRIVIPKEIRRVLRIREGDSMEIYTDAEGEIVLKKYSPIGELSNLAIQFADSISGNCGQITVVTDKDSVIVVSGTNKKHLEGKKISKRLENILDERRLVHNPGGKQFINVVEAGDFEENEQIISPVICDGDIIGGIVIIGKKPDSKLTNVEENLAILASDFLGRRMEV